MNTQRVALYVRVSTQDQSCELQKRELTAYAEARGWHIAGIYEDKATGTNANRPMLKTLMADARARKVDVLLVWKLDRFARSLKDLLTMLQEISDLGIAFVSFKDQIDMTTAAGRLMMQMIGAFSEFEASLIKERVRAGLANAKAKGKRLGRPTQIDAARASLLRNQGMSLSQIAREMRTTKSGVSKTLRKQSA